MLPLSNCTALISKAKTLLFHECCSAGNCSPLSPAAEASPRAWSEGTDPQTWLAPDGTGPHELCWMALCIDCEAKNSNVSKTTF